LRFRQNIALTLPGLGPQNAPDGRRQPPPPSCLFDELFAAQLCEPVEARLTVVPRGSPLSRDPTPLLQPLEGGIKSSVLDQQLVLGRPLDSARDTLAVLRAEDQRPQDQQVERALQEFQPVFLLLGRHVTQVSNFG
jgi:hypothetical protein